MFWGQAIQHATHTDIGLRRKNNEDACLVHVCKNELEWRKSGHLLIVADGMGGHAVGELASSMAIEIVPHSFLKANDGDPRSTLKRAIEAANEAIHTRGTQNQDFLHMGTTCSCVALTNQGAIIGHIGDSRAYRIRRDRIDQLTFDHSLEWEMERKHGVSTGIDFSKHRNVITRSLGPEAVVNVDVEGPYPIFPGDTFLLCSDGLSNLVQDSEIGAIVRELSAAQASRLLIQLANFRGGTDNSTVVIARVGDLPANIPPSTIPDEIDERFNLDWSWLIGFCVGAMALVLGLSLALTGKHILGGVLSTLAVTGMLSLVIAAANRRRRLMLEHADSSRTNLWRPHRTAVCLTSAELFELLVAVNNKIASDAKDDGWAINWKTHEAAVKAAQQAATEKRFSRGVRDLARAIDCIMKELPNQAVSK